MSQNKQNPMVFLEASNPRGHRHKQGFRLIAVSDGQSMGEESCTTHSKATGRDEDNL